MVPPPTPSWAPSAQPPAPAMPDFGMPAQQQPPAPTAPQPPPSLQPPSPSSTAPERMRPPLQLSVEPSAPTPASPLVPVDPEDTAAWTFNPDEDDSGAYGAVPLTPGWGTSRLPANEKPALPAAADAQPNPFGLGDQPGPAESIVPESWFAQPRQPAGADADATRCGAGRAAPSRPACRTRRSSPPPRCRGSAGTSTRRGWTPALLPDGRPDGADGADGSARDGPDGRDGSGRSRIWRLPPQQPPPGPKSGGTSKPLIAAVAALVTVAAGPGVRRVAVR